MRVEKNNSIYMGDSTKSQRAGKAAQKEKKGNKVFAGDLNMADDPIAKKKKEAQKKALKVVGDAFDNERKVDDEVQKHRDRISELKETMANDKKNLRQIEEDKVSLKEKYEISDDSEEQKDLELLEKSVASQQKGSTVRLTRDEQKEVVRIKAKGLTEYQEHSLQMDKYIKAYNDEIAEAEKEMKGENTVVREAKLERLKSNPMVDATKEADEIKKAASGEIIGMLQDEVKQHIDELNEESKERAEKKAEEKAEQEKILEAAKERREETEQLTDRKKEDTDDKKNTNIITENMDILDKKQKDPGKEVESIVDKMNLLLEDIKGAVVDSNL